MSWFEQAACQGRDTDLFFPGRGQPVGPAKRVCQTCPVIADCLAYALTHEIKEGVWGGTSENQRRFMRRDIRNTIGDTRISRSNER